MARKKTHQVTVFNRDGVADQFNIVGKWMLKEFLKAPTRTVKDARYLRIHRLERNGRRQFIRAVRFTPLAA